METENPARAVHGASVSIAADALSSTQKRPILQANGAMRLRLRALLWTFKMGAAR